MKKIISLPNIYLFLWTVYYTQGVVFSQGNILSKLVLLLFLSISLYYTILTYTKYQIGQYLRALGYLLVMFTVYGVIGVISGVSFDYLKLIYLSLLPTFPLFVWTKEGKISFKWIRTSFFAMVTVISIQYITAVNSISMQYEETENAVVNVAYEVLALIPLLYFWKERPLIQYVMLAIILIVVLSTVKRGAIMIGIVCVSYFFYTTIQGTSKKTKLSIWLLVFVFVVVGTKYVVNFYENSSYAQLRMEQSLEGDSSGRDEIFLDAWTIFINSNPFNMLFGNGAWATLRRMKILAHNDWLEILVNQGLVGVVVYLLYWLSFFKTFINDKNLITRPVLGTLFIIYFFATFFSMSYSAMTLPANLALGYSLAKRNFNPSIE